MATTGRESLEIITRQIKELVGIYRGAVIGSGISENEFWIWYTLIVMEGDYSQQDICEAWSLSKQTVNTIISHLVKDGLVTLDVVPGTRNRKIISLTDEGRKFGEALVSPICLAEEKAIARLPERDRIACTLAFERYITVLKEEIGKLQKNEK